MYISIFWWVLKLCTNFENGRLGELLYSFLWKAASERLKTYTDVLKIFPCKLRRNFKQTPFYFDWDRSSIFHKIV